jgi:hypothetical protein
MEFDYFKNMILHESINNLKLGERVYKNAYSARLIDVMGKHFPTLQFILDDLFPHLVRDYLATHRPTSWAVDHIGHKFADFIYRETAHYNFGVPSQLIGDITIFEETQNECAVAEDVFLLKPEYLQKLNVEDWNTLSFQLAPSSRLLHTQYPVHGIIEAALKKELAEPPAPEPTFYLLHRLENRMHWLVMPERLATFLQVQMSNNLLSAADVHDGELVLKEFTALLVNQSEIFRQPNI